jgi:high-affinity iron transporter
VVVVAATFFIFLREGVEASMIIAILLAYLDKTGQRRYFRDVLAGVAAAGVLIAGGGTAAYLLLKSYAGSRTQTIFETVTYLVAAVVLTYMTFWMRNHARTIGADLRSRADAAMDGRARWGLGILAFQAVGREGLETMVFTLAIVFASSGRGALAGGAGGLVVALAIAAAIYRFGRRVDLGRFFTVVGALLMVFAAGLLADAVQNLQELGWVKVLTGVLWNTSGALSEDSTGGDILHSFFGYADQPTVLQAVVYLLYLAAAVYAFLRLGRPRACPEQTKSRVAVGASTPAPSGRSGAAAV